MLIEVPNDVALRLQDMAAERGCTVGEILRDWVGGEPSEQKYGTLADMVENAKAANLDRKEAQPSASSEDEFDFDNPPPGSLAALALNARKANFGKSKYTDTAARSREILNTEFADYIRRNWGK